MHWDWYHKGKISLKQARHLQGLKISAMRTKNRKRKKQILKEYHMEEKMVRIS